MNSVSNLKPFSLFSETITLTISPFLQKIGVVALAIIALYAIYSIFFSSSESLGQKKIDDMNRKLDNFDGRLTVLVNTVNSIHQKVAEIKEACNVDDDDSQDDQEFKRG